jgi:acyl carrier protein
MAARKTRQQNRARANSVSMTGSEPVPQFDATQARQQTQQTSPDDLEQILLGFVVEQTGYPADLINLDWDLEADLGIDSIKRAQLLGELREIFHLETDDRKSLEAVRTLRQILDRLRARVLDQEPASKQGPSPTTQPIAKQPEKAESITTVAAASARESAPKRNIEKFLVDFVVEQTGYPPEIVDLDADFEADLGIDSIKKSQLFGELREQFRFNVGNSDRVSLTSFRTLRQVLAALDASATEQLPSPTSLEERLRTTRREDDDRKSLQRYWRGVNRQLSRDRIPMGPGIRRVKSAMMPGTWLV